jgi:hypothetical protein
VTRVFIGLSYISLPCLKSREWCCSSSVYRRELHLLVERLTLSLVVVFTHAIGEEEWTKNNHWPQKYCLLYIEKFMCALYLGTKKIH